MNAMRAPRLLGAWMLAAFCFAAEPRRVFVLLPEGFRGWACADFRVAGAPPLPREGDAVIVRIRKGEVLKTSDKPVAALYSPQAWIEVNGERRSVPQDMELGGPSSSTGRGSPVERYCFFAGTQDERDLAGEPPGFPPSPPGRGVPKEERQALLALYDATDGAHWKHHAGWPGPPGTECKWHGVVCGHPRGEQVTALELGDNSLAGPVPEALGQLKRLEWLTLYGNRLSGRLPASLLQRWLTGELAISAEAHLFTDVSEIEFEFDASSLLCGWHRFIVRADDSAILLTTRCRNATPGDRATFCEVKEGHANGMAMLGWLLEKNGFFSLQPKYYGNISDSTFQTTRVTRNGRRYEVEDYAGGGPFELWVIETAIEGVAAGAEWEKTTTRPRCPGRAHHE